MNEAIPPAIVSIIVLIVGFLLRRSIDGLDKKLETHSKKLDDLRDKDTSIEVQLAEVKVRILHVESEMETLRRAK